MKILTRTYPPSSNPNYGGILQAWALQQVLVEMGHESFVDSTRSNQPSRYKLVVENIVLRALEPLARLGLPVPGRKRLIRQLVNKRLLEFPKRNIRQVPVYIGNGQHDQSVVDAFDAFIVGSDQVWRPRYVNVPSFLFNFIADECAKPLIAYAASFGRSDSSEFSSELRDECRLLAKRMTKISTRETSGVELARTLWGVEASQMPDPTLLIEPGKYPRTLENSIDSGCLIDYVLDNTKDKEEIIEYVSRVTQKNRSSIIPSRAANYKELKSAPEMYQKMSIEEWITRISESGFVITDSFHGTVFSLLFNRPFLVIPNPERGLARFEDLLGSFGLKERMVSSIEEAHKIALEEIDWGRINAKIADERIRGKDFLSQSLKPQKSTI